MDRKDIIKKIATDTDLSKDERKNKIKEVATTLAPLAVNVAGMTALGYFGGDYAGRYLNDPDLATAMARAGSVFGAAKGFNMSETEAERKRLNRKLDKLLESKQASEVKDALEKIAAEDIELAEKVAKVLRDVRISGKDGDIIGLNEGAPSAVFVNEPFLRTKDANEYDTLVREEFLNVPEDKYEELLNYQKNNPKAYKKLVSEIISKNKGLDGRLQYRTIKPLLFNKKKYEEALKDPVWNLKLTPNSNARELMLNKYMKMKAEQKGDLKNALKYYESQKQASEVKDALEKIAAEDIELAEKVAKEILEKQALLGVGARVKDFGEGDDKGNRWGLSVGFPYLLGVDRTFGGGGIRPSAGVGLLGPKVGLSFGHPNYNKMTDKQKAFMNEFSKLSKEDKEKYIKKVKENQIGKQAGVSSALKKNLKNYKKVIKGDKVKKITEELKNHKTPEWQEYLNKLLSEAKKETRKAKVMTGAGLAGVSGVGTGAGMALSKKRKEDA